MPTINQLVRKGRVSKSKKNLIHQHLTEATIAVKNWRQIKTPHKNVEFVLVLVH